MKKLITILFIGYLVIHPRILEHWEQGGIDPGINPDWIGYQDEYHFFDTIKDVLIYLNKGVVRSAEVYKTEEIEIERIDKERIDTVKSIEHKWQLKK